MNTFSPLQYFLTLSVICGDAPPVNVSGHPSCCSEHFPVHSRVCCVPRVLCERIPREVNADCRHQRIYGLLRERAHLYCTSEPPTTPCRLRDRRYPAGKDAKRTKRRHCATQNVALLCQSTTPKHNVQHIVSHMLALTPGPCNVEK